MGTTVTIRHEAGIPAIECDGLTKRFGGVRAINGLTTFFEAGKVTALIGPNGAGKTTLFHLIAGNLRPDAGHIRYDGKRIDGLAPDTVARMGIGRLFQDTRAFSRLTALENVSLAGQAQHGENPLCAMLRPRLVACEERAIAERAMTWLGHVGLADMARSRAGDLSYGQQKLLAIARLLMADARVLLLDEPTAGINPTMVSGILKIVRGAAEAGKTPVVIEHDLNVVAEVADWVTFIDEGQVVAFGLPQEVLSDRHVRAAYLGA